LFFFQADSLGRLDAYQRLEGEIPATVTGVSRSGEQILVAFAGYAADRYAWGDVDTYAAIRERSFSLAEDRPDAPFLSASCHLDEGASRSASLTLRPMLSAIRIRTLSCPFSGMPYEGRTLDSLKLFLSYVCDRCRPLQAGEDRSVSWMNPGYADSSAIARMARPDMVLQETGLSVGAARKTLGNTLYAYPNPAVDDAFGQMRTRLVLQGILDGQVCYYPIPLPDLRPSRVLEVDITLTRMGSPDPDIPTESGAVVLETETVPWQEADASTVHF